MIDACIYIYTPVFTHTHTHTHKRTHLETPGKPRKTQRQLHTPLNTYTRIWTYTSYLLTEHYVITLDYLIALSASLWGPPCLSPLPRFQLDHARSNLIWNLKTREELRDGLEGEMRAFSVDRELGSASVISWNHQEFEVQAEKWPKNDPRPLEQK